MSTIGTIECEATGAFMKPISRDGKVQDGLNISCAIVDEIHAHKTPETYNVIITAVGARLEPITWIISTAGDNQDGIGFSQYNYGKSIPIGRCRG